MKILSFRKLLFVRHIALAATCMLVACSAPAQRAQPPAKAPARAQAPAAPVELSERMLYDLLLGEIALQRGDAALAAKTFGDLARRTRDLRVVRRAVEVANQARLPDLAVDAAKLWYELEPASQQTLQVLAALLITAKRVDEAQPYLEKLLEGEGVNVENGFMQLGRLLAGNPDKTANLRVVRSLAARHPKLAPAQFAVAQAAFAAADESAALAAIRQAQTLRPDWEAAAIFEAQVLQKRSPAAAAKRLGAFIAKNPNSREARLSYARVLVQDKRFPEAREQFEALLAANPGNTDVVYAVGLLAFQLKDFPVAEQNMKRLLGMPYRDHDGVRYLLGQIAEEQKLWGNAIDWYQSIGTGEHAVPARMRTANAIAKQGKLDDARAFLQRVAADHPDQEVQLIVAEAQLLRDANRAPDAFQVLGQALQKDPDQPELLYDFALTAEKLERYDVLESNLRKLIQMRPDHAHAYNALGYSYAERNMKLPEARKLIERALELAPEDYFIIDSLGWVMYRQGDLKGALAQLQRAYDGRPDAEIGAHLGEVLWKLGRTTEANRVWQESLKAGPENETLLRTIKRLRQ
jgi:tetratricopeptide (TPR) repeat protein